MQVEFTYHKVHPSQVYNSVGFTTSICYYIHYPKKKPYVSQFSPPLLLGTSNLISVSIDLYNIMDIIIKMESYSMWSFVYSFFHLA